MKPSSAYRIDRDAEGHVLSIIPLRFIPLRNIRPLNNAMLKRAS